MNPSADGLSRRYCDKAQDFCRAAVAFYENPSESSLRRMNANIDLFNKVQRKWYREH